MVLTTTHPSRGAADARSRRPERPRRSGLTRLAGRVRFHLEEGRGMMRRGMPSGRLVGWNVGPDPIRGIRRNRRGSRRFSAHARPSQIGWMDGERFVTASLSLMDVSLGGLSALARQELPASTTVWVALDDHSAGRLGQSGGARSQAGAEAARAPQAAVPDPDEIWPGMSLYVLQLGDQRRRVAGSRNETE